MTSEEKDRMINRLLYFLSQHPQGVTTLELKERIGELSKEQIVELLKECRDAHQAGIKGGPVNNPAHSWELRRYIPGSEEEEDQKRKIMLGSRRK